MPISEPVPREEKIMMQVTCDITEETIAAIRQEMHECIDAAIDAIHEKLKEQFPKKEN